VRLRFLGLRLTPNLKIYEPHHYMTYPIMQPPYPSILYNWINSIHLKIKFLPLHTLKSHEISRDISMNSSREEFHSIHRSNLGISKRCNLRKERGENPLTIIQPDRPRRPPRPGWPPPSRGLAGRRCWARARAPPDPRGEGERARVGRKS